MKKTGRRKEGDGLLVCPHCGGVLPGGKGVRARGRYALRRRQKVWQLVFDGQAAQFKHEKAAGYVARLLAEGGPFHAVDLANPDGAMVMRIGNEARLADIVEIGGKVQERSAALDEREAMRRLVEHRRRLEEEANDESVSTAVRAAAREDMEAIDRYLRAQPKRQTDNAQKTVRAVRMAIKRFCRNLASSVDGRGRPEPVLTAFGNHLWHYLFVPSARYSDARGREARRGLAGCFLYERPAGVEWVVEV